MRIELDETGTKIALEAPTTAAPTVRQIPGAAHDSKRQMWYLPLSWASCITARGVIGATLEVGPELAEWARNEVQTRVAPSMAARDAKDAPAEVGVLIDDIEAKVEAESGASRGPFHLRPDQRAGAAFITSAGSALLGDEMRLGKTPQMIRGLQLLQATGHDIFPVLVVSPNGVKRPWRTEFKKWFPSARVVVPKNGTAHVRAGIGEIERGEADVLILNYEAVPKVSKLGHYSGARRKDCTDCNPLSTGKPASCQKCDRELNRIHWSTVVADEVHRAANPSGVYTRALWAVGDTADRRFGLTGSAPEDPAGAWAVMRFVFPLEYPAKTAWVDRYVLTRQNIFSGYPDTIGYKPEHRAELDKIMLPRFIRRTRAAVFPNDPPPIYLPRYVQLTGKQLKAYNDFRKNLLAEVDAGVIYSTNPLTKMLRLRQLASAYGTATESGGMLLSEPSSKLDEFEIALEELGDQPVVVFAESRQLIMLAEARMVKRGERKTGLVVGGIDEEQRALDVEAFQDGKLDMLLCTVGAGGEGLTMNAADTALFLQRPWDRKLNQQAQDRIVLPGLGANTTIIEIIAEDTVDERVRESLADKDARFEDLVRDVDTLRRWLA